MLPSEMRLTHHHNRPDRCRLMWIVRDDLLNDRRKEIEMIRFSGIDFLPVDPVNVGFIPVHVEFRKGKIPRLVDCDGNRIAAWRLP